jgi:hypothetical protein
MLADTRPAYATPNKCQRARQKSRSNTVLNDTVNYAVKMDVDTQEQEHLVSIKRQTSQSPTLIQPTPKHSKRRYSEITMSDRTYIEILSSDSDREPMPSSSVKKAGLCPLSHNPSNVYHFSQLRRRPPPTNPVSRNPDPPQNQNGNVPTSLLNLLSQPLPLRPPFPPLPHSISNSRLLNAQKSTNLIHPSTNTLNIGNLTEIPSFRSAIYGSSSNVAT